MPKQKCGLCPLVTNQWYISDILKPRSKNFLKAFLKELKYVKRGLIDHLTENYHVFVKGKTYIPEKLEERVVIFLHGYLHGYGFLKSFERFNIESPLLILPYFYCFSPKNLTQHSFQDMRISAQGLKEYIDYLQTRGVKEFDLVGHSQGGLINRYFIEFLGGKKVVRKCITLGTPHHGTLMAKWFGLGQGARQMEPGSSFLKELNAKGLSVTYISIRTIYDQLVIPSSSSHLKGAVNICLGLPPYEDNNVMHLGLIEDKGVYKIVMEDLIR